MKNTYIKHICFYSVIIALVCIIISYIVPWGVTGPIYNTDFYSSGFTNYDKWVTIFSEDTFHEVFSTTEVK